MKSRNYYQGVFIGKIAGRMTRDHFGCKVRSQGGKQTRKHRKEMKLQFKSGKIHDDIPF